MVSWGAFHQAEPDFATRVQRLFDGGRHKTIATVRADGSPRISGIECEFEDGELQFGSMSASRKGADLARDPRIALHGPTSSPEEGNEAAWPGEAKISGRAVIVEPVAANEDTGEDAPGDDNEEEGPRYRVDLHEVVITKLNDEATMLVVESWTPTGGLRRVERA